MKFNRIAFASLFLTSPIVNAFLPLAVAEAEENIFVGGVAELLPGEPILADGSTQATLYFLFLNPDGTPQTGITGKTEIGVVKGTLKEEGNGLYSTTLTPEALSASTSDFVKINAKTLTKSTIKTSYPIQLIAAPQGSITMEASPNEITLGQDDFVTIKVKVPSEYQNDKLHISVSTGEVDTLVSLGNGQYSARYTPPSKKIFPHAAVFTVSDMTHPELKGHLVLQQKGKANFPVNTNANSNVIIRIGERDFGPVQTDASGKASIPIVAPPGQTNATLIIISNEQRKEELVDLRIPRIVPRLNIFTPFVEMPADGVSKQKMTVFVATAKGLPDTTATLTCTAEFGECSPVKSLGNGYYEASYTAPQLNSKTTEKISFVLQDQVGEISDAETFTLLPVLPGSISLKSALQELPKNVAEFGVTVQVKGPLGKGLDDRNLLILANGAKSRPPTALNSGDYAIKLTPTSDNPIEVTAAVKGSASTNPAFGMAMRANVDRLPNDGISSTLLTFMVYDRFGQPIANQEINLAVEGGGSMPTKANTSSAGFAQVNYTSGTTSGLVKITASTANLKRTFYVYVAPTEQLSLLPELKRSQNQFHQRMQEKLNGSIGHTRFEREGMTGVPLTGQIDRVGVPTQIGIKAEPNKVAPGGKTTLHMSVTDSNGRGVSGEVLTVLSSSGTIGKVQDLGSGQYSVTAIAPENGADKISIVVQNQDGSIEQKYTLQIVGGTTATEGTETTPIAAITDPADSTIPEDGPTTSEKKPKEPKVKEPKPPKEPKTPKQPRERTQRSVDAASTPYLRASLGYVGGVYGYQQVPTSTTGVLYEKAISFNKETEGSSPAYTAGLDIRAMGFVPTLSKIGYDVHINSDHYGIALAEFPEPIGDWMTSMDAMIVGRHTLSNNGWLITPSVRAGVLRDDLILFRQNIQDDGNIELSYEPLFVNALNLGVGFDVDGSNGLFVHLNYDLGIHGSIYRYKLDSQAGYALNEDWYIFAGGRSTTRNVDIETSTSKAGEIHDGNLSFIAGFGGSFR